MKKQRKKKNEQEATQKVECPAIESPAPAPSALVRRPYYVRNPQDYMDTLLMHSPGYGRWMMSFCEEKGLRIRQRQRYQMLWSRPLPGPPSQLTCVQPPHRKDGACVLRLVKSKPSTDHALEHALPHER